ncbi:MAG: hypothetical protein H6657_01900 [Ardenticatenaceae bacterium]|nr:hypothetical protein [Ardenticatenaceae bacterium]
MHEERFGEVDIQWWIGNEYRTDLFEAGTSVPKPIGRRATILMQYIRGCVGLPR